MGDLQDRYEAMCVKAETNAKKGVKGGDCNVTQCQEPDSAFYFNKSTRKYYCEHCAFEINKVNRRDSMKLYGVPDLCELDAEEPPLPTVEEPVFLTRSQWKKKLAREHNERYDAERARWNSMTKEEQNHELVRKGVDSAINHMRPQIKMMLGSGQ